MRKIFLDIPTSELNKCDPNGNSPLLMAVKLAHKNEAFQEVIKNILKAGGNPKIKDSNGWTPLDESITQVIKTKFMHFKFMSLNIQITYITLFLFYRRM